MRLLLSSPGLDLGFSSRIFIVNALSQLADYVKDKKYHDIAQSLAVGSVSLGLAGAASLLTEICV